MLFQQFTKINNSIRFICFIEICMPNLVPIAILVTKINAFIQTDKQKTQI